MQTDTTINPAKFKVIIAAVLLVAVLIGSAFVFLRIVDADEGFYLSAANMVAQGDKPYLDFFFPQMPFLPIALAPLSSAGMSSLFLARIFGFICHLILGFLVYRIAKMMFNDSRISLIAMAVTIFSGPLLTWNSLAKPYFLANMFFVASFLMLIILLSKREANYLHLLLAFIFLGITFNIRSVFIIFVPLYFFLTFFFYKSAGTLKLRYYLPVMLIGLIFPSLYSLRLFIASPDLFTFNNLGYHLLREQAPGFIYLLKTKIIVLGKVLIQPQFFIVLGLAIWSLVLVNSHKFKNYYNSWQKMVVQLAVVVSAFITAIYLIPHPCHVQYFSQALIFLIIASLPAVKFILTKYKSISYTLAAVYILAFLIYPALYIMDIRSKYLNYSIRHVRQVTKFIQANSASTDTILTEWPAYYVFADRRQTSMGEYCGFQYDFSSPIIPYDKYKLLSNEKINQVLKSREPKLVVISNYVIGEWKKELENNYKILTQIDDTYIYERKAAGQAS